MAEIINLRQARKAKSRDVKEVEAAANRAKFGQSKAAKQAEAAQKSLAAAKLDGQKREK